MHVKNIPEKIMTIMNYMSTRLLLLCLFTVHHKLDDSLRSMANPKIFFTTFLSIISIIYLFDFGLPKDFNTSPFTI